MKPDEVNSTNEQHLLDTVYNYKRELSAAATAPSIGSKSLKKSSKAAKRKKSVQHRRCAKFKVGEHVRISKHRHLFDKSYTPNWTTEIFTISKVQYHNDPITFLIRDHRNEDIKGCFYAEELQSVKHPNVYLIDRILKRNKNQVYIQWLGLGPEHNSWISKNKIL